MHRSLNITTPIISGFIGIIVSFFLSLNQYFRIDLIESPLSALYIIFGQLRPIGFVVGSVIIYETYASEISNGTTAFWISLGIGKKRYVLLKLWTIYISMILYWLAIIISFSELFSSIDNSTILLINTILGDTALLIIIGFLISNYTQRIEAVILATTGLTTFIRSGMPGILLTRIIPQHTSKLMAIIDPVSAATQSLDLFHNKITDNFFTFANIGLTTLIILSLTIPLHTIKKRRLETP